MPDFQQAFSTVTDTDYLVDAAMVGGGYMSGVLAKALVEGRLGQDFPNLVYGAPAMVGGAAMGQMEVAMGGGAYAAVAGARSAGIESAAVSALGGSA
jgi:hypothetical protein